MIEGPSIEQVRPHEDAPYTLNGIPLVDLDELHLRDAQAAPLIALLAEIVISTCTQATAVPTTHVSAA